MNIASELSTAILAVLLISIVFLQNAEDSQIGYSVDDINKIGAIVAPDVDYLTELETARMEGRI